jgi:hypothetical protein
MGFWDSVPGWSAGWSGGRSRAELSSVNVAWDNAGQGVQRCGKYEVGYRGKRRGGREKGWKSKGRWDQRTVTIDCGKAE